MTTFYKIRDKNTGLFSTGGVDALTHPGSWSKTGKVWRTEGQLKQHLRQYIRVTDYWPKRKEVSQIPDHWEVVTYVVAEQSVKPAKPLITPTWED